MIQKVAHKFLSSGWRAWATARHCVGMTRIGFTGAMPCTLLSSTGTNSPLRLTKRGSAG